MLDNLVESSSHAGESAKRGGFLLTTLVLVFALFFGGILWSLFAKDFGIGGEDLELSQLVAPVQVADEPPPPPEPKPKDAKPVVNADVRKEIIQNMEESPKEPEKITNTK